MVLLVNFVNKIDEDIYMLSKFNISSGNITSMILEVVNNTFSLAVSPNFIVLFPRPDFKGSVYVPQLFVILPKSKPPEESFSNISNEQAAVNVDSAQGEFFNYNVSSNPEIINISNGILSSVYDKGLVELLKKTSFANSVLEFDTNFVKLHFREKFKMGAYYSVYGPLLGFHEVAIINSLKFMDTAFIEEINVSLRIKILKTFNFFTYKG
ncbi:DUF792 family protein [Borrelia persica]|uniref:DUF792 family protein n=1 Tax=Borrelia persica TaxID=44448 RepID=UPI000463B5FB|nr:DUF792 family protein [Borrelia persica]